MFISSKRVLMSLLFGFCLVSLLSACGDDETVEPEEVEAAIALHARPSLIAYQHGPSLILGEVIAEPGTEVDIQVKVEPPMPVSLSQARGEGNWVFEVFLRPGAEHVGQEFVLTVEAPRGGADAHASVNGEVADAEDMGSEFADSLLEIFLSHIETHHPELALSPSTEWIESWDPEPMTLVVAHRNYLHASWELALSWHVTIAPYDWATISLRRRDSLLPEMALCMPSHKDDPTVREADVSDPIVSCVDPVD